MLIYADVEANGLKPTEIHCICVHTARYGPMTFLEMDVFYEWVESLRKKHVDLTWVFHNGLNYDVDVINALTDVHIDTKDVIDTMVVSKLKDYQKFKTHSLAEIGEFLGVYKGDYTGGWDVRTKEMVEYCEQDVVVLRAIYNYLLPFMRDTSNSKALRVEHDFAVVCKDMGKAGFPFNRDEAAQLLADVTLEMLELERGFRSILDNKRVEVNRIKLRKKANGELYANCIRALSENDDTEIVGDEIIIYGTREFNPASPKQRIDALWEYGWKPTDKTVGHIKSTRRHR